MGKNVIINGTTYNNVPKVEIPLASGSGNAEFYEISEADATAADLLAGKKAYGASGEITGTIASKAYGSGTSRTNGSVNVEAGYYPNGTVHPIDPATHTESLSLVGGTSSGKVNVIGDTETDYEIVASGEFKITADGYVATQTIAPANKTKYVQVETKIVTPTTQGQVIQPTSGKLIKEINVYGVDVSGTATEADVMSGKTFFSGGSLTRRTGTATVPIVGYNSTTHVLTVQ